MTSSFHASAGRHFSHKYVLAGFGALVVACAAFGLGYLGGHQAPRQSLKADASKVSTDNPAKTPGGQREVAYWYAPMAPQQHFDHPGRSPMGMELQPRYVDEVAANRDVVAVSPSIEQNLGIRTAAVTTGELPTTLRVPGTVRWNLRNVVTVSARTDAVIEHLAANAPFDSVRAGAPIATLLAPQWLAAVNEYRALQQADSKDGKALLGPARERLRQLGLTDADIRNTTAGPSAAITLHAPRSGVVATLDVREGQRVAAGQTLMTIGNLDSIWVEAALPQSAAAQVHAGDQVSVFNPAHPGTALHGNVEAVLPQIDRVTRTRSARIEIANPDGALTPGEFVTVRVHADTAAPTLLVPDDAIIASGDAPRVIIRAGKGRFRAAAVQLGRSGGGYTQVLDGLAAGEQVVVSGQFLIDSEASLSGALSRLNASQPATPPTMPAMSPQPATRAEPSPSTQPTPASGHAMPADMQMDSMQMAAPANEHTEAQP